MANKYVSQKEADENSQRLLQMKRGAKSVGSDMSVEDLREALKRGKPQPRAQEASPLVEALSKPADDGKNWLQRKIENAGRRFRPDYQKMEQAITEGRHATR